MNTFQNAKIIGTEVDPSVYHQFGEKKRGHPNFVMSRSEISDFIRNPNSWLRGFENDETESTEFGTVVDCIALTPKRFFEQFAICPETYTNKKGEKSAWRNDMRIAEVAEWHEANKGRLIVKQDANAGAHAAAERLNSDEKISALLGCSDVQVFVTAEYHDKETQRIVPVKALIDIVPKTGSAFQHCLADLKTARNASKGAWPRVCFDQGYHVQAAFYMDLYAAATDESRTDWLHVLVENKPPYAIGRRVLTADFLTMGRDQYLAGLRDYCACLENNSWPGYDDVGEDWNSWNGWTITHPELWMVQRSGVSV